MNKLINIQKKTAHTILQMAQQYDLGTLLDAISLVFSNVTFLTGSELGDLFSEYTQQHYLSSSGDDPAADFISTLLRYWDFRKTDYYKMFTTLSSNYDPIENYSMTERGSDGKRLGKQTITETPSGSESIATTYSGTKSTAATGTKITTVTPEGGTTTTETPSGTSSVTETESAGRTVTATTSRTTFDDTTNYKPVEKVETSDVPNTGYERKTETAYDHYSIETAIPVLCKLGAPEALKELTSSGVEPVCAARFTRLAKNLTAQGCIVELALDRGVLLGGGKELPFAEIEVELKAGSEDAAVAFANSLAKEFDLTAEPASKFKRALALAEEL